MPELIRRPGFGLYPCLLATAALWASAVAAGPSGLSAERAAEIRSACSDLVVRYAYARDRLDYQAYGDMFTDDATFELAGKKTTGREQLIAELRKRGPQAITRHVSTPVGVEPLSETSASGLAYLQLYTAPRNAGASGPAVHPGPPIFAEYHDTYSIAGKACRFHSRRIEIIFTPD